MLNSKKKIAYFLVAILTFSASALNLSYAGNVNGTTKATATLTASCQIQTVNINFGVIDPKTSSSGVSASSSMSLFCSKGAAYSISLGGSNSGYTLDGDYLGSNYACPNNCAGIPTNYHYFYVYAGATDYTQTPANYVSRVLYHNGTVVSNTNILKGLVSGDTISYKITLPGDDSKIWNRGNYAYTNTGTGATQNFVVKATLTTTSYPTPDSYSDTQTAIVSF